MRVDRSRRDQTVWSLVTRLRAALRTSSTDFSSYRIFPFIIAAVGVMLTSLLVGCECGAARAEEVPLALRLRARAEAEERTDDTETWDEASNLSLSIRARVTLMRAGVFDQKTEARIFARALQTSARVLALEATGPRGRKFLPASTPEARGWGTSKGIRLAGVSASVAVDAYSTGSALLALGELAGYAAESGRQAQARALDRALAPVFAHWREQRRFELAEGVASWDKLVTPALEARRFAVFNTDALLAQAFAREGELARRQGQAERAARARALVRETARSLQRLVIEPVLAEGALRPARWRYGVEGPTLAPMRVEDSNHASYVLEFLSSEPEAFAPQVVAGLCALLRERVFVRRADGTPAYTVFVGAGDVQSSLRGKRKLTGFSFVPEAARRRPLTSWWKELDGGRRTLDDGLSIRTSWGWSRCAQRDRALFGELGRYLETASDTRRLPANLFLARATWWALAR